MKLKNMNCIKTRFNYTNLKLQASLSRSDRVRGAAMKAVSREGSDRVSLFSLLLKLLISVII